MYRSIIFGASSFPDPFLNNKRVHEKVGIAVKLAALTGCASVNKQQYPNVVFTKNGVVEDAYSRLRALTARELRNQGLKPVISFIGRSKNDIKDRPLRHIDFIEV